MPESGAGDMIHNFFGEDNLSQGQHSRGIDSTWSAPSNSPWAGNKQIGAHIYSNLKNNNIQQSVYSGRLHGGQVSVQHGLNFSRSNLGPGFSGSQAQGQQPTSNDYMHGHPVCQMRQNGSNLSGVESDHHNAMLPLTNGLELESNSVRMNFPESPVNYDIFGGQQQMSNQIPSMLQSLPGQHSGLSDVQMQQQQQLMLKQIKEFQRQQHLEKQQLQHQESRSLTSMNHDNSFPKQTAFGRSTAMINEFPVQNGCNYSQQHEVMETNTNWPQRCLSPIGQGSFTGQMFSSEQVEVPCSIGMVSQQFDQSLYGVPISGTRVSLHQIPSNQMDKSLTQEIPGCNSFTGFPLQVGVQDGGLVSREEYQGKSMVGAPDSQGINIGFNLGFQHENPQHSNESMHKLHGRQEVGCHSETVQENPVMQVTRLQNVATLDPTEEKILFGSDDNLWDAFAKETNAGSSGYNITDTTTILGTLPSIQSGSWSALMQSAVAETSSTDLGLQEEWSGLTFHNSEPPVGNQQSLNDSGKQQLVWADNRLQPSAQNLRTFPLSDETNGSMNCSITGIQQMGFSTFHQQAEQLQTGSPQGSVTRPKSMLSSSASSSDKVHNNAVNKTMTSQNMLELIHKLDQSRDRGIAMQLSSSLQNQSSEMSEAETSDGSVPPQQKQNQSAPSQGFGLRLPPFSQHSPAPDHAFACQSPSRTVNSLSSAHPTVDKGEKGYVRDNISGASGLSRNNTQGHFSADFPYARSHLQNQHVTDAGGQWASSRPANMSFNRFNPQSKQVNESFAGDKTNQLAPARDASHHDLTNANEMFQPSMFNVNAAKGSTQHFPLLEAASEPQSHGMSGMSQEDSARKMSPSMVWNSISTQQHSFGFRTPPSTVFKPNFQSNFKPEMMCSQPQSLEDKNTHMGGIGPSESDACSVNPHGFVGAEQPDRGSSLLRSSPGNDISEKATGVLQANVSVGHHEAATSFPNPASTQKEIEAFGRTLRPNNTLHQNYSSPHPVQGVKNIEVSGNDVLKGSKGCSGAVDHHLESTEGVHQFVGQHSEDASTNCSTVPYGDTAMLRFSANPINDGDGNTRSQDMLEFGQNGAPSSCMGEHSQISPLMAPSWFEQYGTFKNGQILAMYDSREPIIMKTAELPSNIGRSATVHAPSKAEQVNYVAADASHCDISHKNSMNISTSHFLDPDASMRLKKRRIGTSELVPWHKELIQSHQRLQHIRTAEIEWSMTANCLSEKVGEEGKMLDVGSPVHRSKRRLILTTQLMQQLLHPPLASILSVDAFSHYDSATYFVARSTAGDACSSISCPASDTPVSSNSENILPEKLQSSRRGSSLPETMEDLISKARKVENDLLRLNKRVSILDLRVECQDLEKFSVINRFAKFHGRGAETTSSDSTINTQKPSPQRYVTAFHMPRNLPVEVGEEGKMLDVGSPVHRSKRRLILTTQLMQQLLHPPLASILSVDAFSHYDSATYFVARSTAGDACSSISCPASDTPVSSNSENILPEKLQSSRRGSSLPETMEDLISKARKVENDLLRLNKRVSILDLRVECQDLEKFSVINRFAKFHGRGAETTSSDSTINTQKPSPQRYVTAFHMPRNLPVEVQCLSL